MIVMAVMQNRTLITFAVAFALAATACAQSSGPAVTSEPATSAATVDTNPDRLLLDYSSLPIDLAISSHWAVTFGNRST